MSSFTTPLKVDVLDEFKESRRLFRLTEPFEFYREEDETEVIHVPKGFVTDFSSVPKFLWPIENPLGPSAKAAVLHDYLYVHAVKNKAYADKVFLEALKVLGVPNLKRHLLYYTVKLFGRGEYK